MYLPSRWGELDVGRCVVDFLELRPVMKLLLVPLPLVLFQVEAVHDWLADRIARHTEHVRTCTYVGPAKYSRIQDNHIMAPTGKPLYGANEITNLAIAFLADITAAMAGERTGDCQTNLPRSERERLHV